MDKVYIRYYVADGYSGKNRPLFVKVDARDFEGCETDAEIVARAEEIVNDDFRQNVFPQIENHGFVQSIRDLMAAEDT